MYLDDIDGLFSFTISEITRNTGILQALLFCLPFVSFSHTYILTNWLCYASVWSHVCNKWTKLFILTFYAFKTKINEWGKWNRFWLLIIIWVFVEYRIRYKSLSECVAEIMWFIEYVFLLLLLAHSRENF